MAERYVIKANCFHNKRYLEEGVIVTMRELGDSIPAHAVRIGADGSELEEYEPDRPMIYPGKDKAAGIKGGRAQKRVEKKVVEVKPEEAEPDEEENE